MYELLMLLIFSIVVAILFNWGSPRFYASSVGNRFGSTFPGHTLATAVVFMGVIWAAAFIFSAVGRKPALP